MNNENLHVEQAEVKLTQLTHLLEVQKLSLENLNQWLGRIAAPVKITT